jgi:hypothetical protein
MTKRDAAEVVMEPPFLFRSMNNPFFDEWNKVRMDDLISGLYRDG